MLRYLVVLYLCSLCLADDAVEFSSELGGTVSVLMTRETEVDPFFDTSFGTTAATRLENSLNLKGTEGWVLPSGGVTRVDKMVVSADNLFLYAFDFTAKTYSVFARNTRSGHLKHVASAWTGFEQASYDAVTDQFVVVKTSGTQIGTISRNTETGLLVHHKFVSVFDSTSYVPDLRHFEVYMLGKHIVYTRTASVTVLSRTYSSTTKESTIAWVATYASILASDGAASSSMIAESDALSPRTTTAMELYVMANNISGTDLAGIKFDEWAVAGTSSFGYSYTSSRLADFQTIGTRTDQESWAFQQHLAVVTKHGLLHLQSNTSTHSMTYAQLHNWVPYTQSAVTSNQCRGGIWYGGNTTSSKTTNRFLLVCGSTVTKWIFNSTLLLEPMDIVHLDTLTLSSVLVSSRDGRFVYLYSSAGISSASSVTEAALKRILLIADYEPPQRTQRSKTAEQAQQIAGTIEAFIVILLLLSIFCFSSKNMRWGFEEFTASSFSCGLVVAVFLINFKVGTLSSFSPT